ncbi:glycosyltransferase [Brachybacterium alimentarium]|uniref:glycosyltransferase n=2 Tax=Brachybacterium alimentarium TaxID=47845 RepID=UPI000DF229D3|nr:glycosyltransferase [Brachybacterium alimentarium]
MSWALLHTSAKGESLKNLRRRHRRSPIYFLVGTIPESFGGMLTVALQRSSTFADLNHQDVTILTRSANMGDPKARARELQSERRLSKRVSIRNAWSELANLSDAELNQIPPRVHTQNITPTALLEYTGEPAARRFGAGGEVLQTDRFRQDGTVYVSDRQDARQPGTLGGRLVTLFGRDGAAIYQWTNMRHLVQAWVEWVIAGESATLIIDAAPTGGLFYDFQRTNITTIQVIHNHHLLQIHSEERREVSADVMNMLTHLDLFDRVAILTPRQQNDMIAAGVVRDNSFVAPNMLIEPAARARPERHRSDGAVVARLVHQKRLDHALQALSIVRSQGHNPTMDIFGTGPLEGELSALSERLGLTDAVRWNGYDARAKEIFGTASYTLISSHYEGHPVAILEAMSAGCIPISYDIEYGPGDIITDGIDGILVSDGNVEALAAAISRVQTMSATERKRMRRAAVRRARQYSPRVIADHWFNHIALARNDKKTLRRIDVHASLMDLSFDADGMLIEIDINAGRTPDIDFVMVGWIGRNRDAYGRTEARLTVTSGKLVAIAHIQAEKLSAIKALSVMDIFLDIHGVESWGRTRVASESVIIPTPLHGMAPYTTVGGNLSMKYPTAETGSSTSSTSP